MKPKPRLPNTSKNSQDEQSESSGYYDYSAARLREYRLIICRIHEVEFQNWELLYLCGKSESESIRHSRRGREAQEPGAAPPHCPPTFDRGWHFV